MMRKSFQAGVCHEGLPLMKFPALMLADILVMQRSCNDCQKQFFSWLTHRRLLVLLGTSSACSPTCSLPSTSGWEEGGAFPGVLLEQLNVGLVNGCNLRSNFTLARSLT